MKLYIYKQTQLNIIYCSTIGALWALDCRWKSKPQTCFFLIIIMRYTLTKVNVQQPKTLYLKHVFYKIYVIRTEMKRNIIYDIDIGFNNWNIFSNLYILSMDEQFQCGKWHTWCSLAKSKKVKWTNIWWYHCSAAEFHLRWHMVCVKSHLSTCAKSIFYLFCNHAKILFHIVRSFAHAQTNLIIASHVLALVVFFFLESIRIKISAQNSTEKSEFDGRHKYSSE